MTEDDYDSSSIKNFLYSISWKRRSKRKNYVINKWLFIVGELLYFLLAFTIIFTNITAFKHPLATCPLDAVRCHNPDYDKISNPDVQEYLLPGQSVGYSTNWLYPNGVYLSLFCLIIPYFINHFLYNKNKKFWVIEGD